MCGKGWQRTISPGITTIPVQSIVSTESPPQPAASSSAVVPTALMRASVMATAPWSGVRARASQSAARDREYGLLCM